MAIPTYQAFMLPHLELAGDGAEHKPVLAVRAGHFGLTADERAHRLPSGTHAPLDNRGRTPPGRVGRQNDD